MATSVSYFTPDNFTPDCSVGYLLRRCHQLGQERLEPIFAAAGLTNMQWSALMAIRVGRARTPAELAREISYDKGATTRLVDSLEERGWATRERCTDDRRVINLALTETGADLGERIRLEVIAEWNKWLADWDTEEVAGLLATLQRLRDRLCAAPAGAAA